MSLLDNHISIFAAEISTLLLKRQWHLAIAESCTGGGIAYALTEIPGSSQWFERGFVTYSNEAKQELLNVPATLIAQHGAVSAEVAQAMAEGALLHSHANITLSITGIAGPDGGSPEKPVGTIWMGIASKRGFPQTQGYTFDGDRHTIREKAVLAALTWLKQQLAF